MSSLFIRLYLDEDVDVLAAEMIRARGFEALTARDVKLLSQDDRAQLNYAAQQGVTLVTHNRADFAVLAQEFFTARKEHHGIIFAVRRSAHELVRRLLMILNHVTADEMKNQVRYI